METNILKMMKIADIASLLNAISGMLAVLAAYYQKPILTAALLILAVVFDAIDGPLARRYPSDTDEIFGETMDSLADVISFGVAPSLIIMILYNNMLMIIPTILLISCGILRLSRYNTIITYQTGPTKTFIGVPIPVSSFMLSIILLSGINNSYIVLIIMTIIAISMITSFKYTKIKNKTILIISTILTLITLCIPLNTLLFKIPSILLILMIMAYIFSPIYIK